MCNRGGGGEGRKNWHQQATTYTIKWPSWHKPFSIFLKSREEIHTYTWTTDLFFLSLYPDVEQEQAEVYAAYYSQMQAFYAQQQGFSAQNLNPASAPSTFEAGNLTIQVVRIFNLYCCKMLMTLHSSFFCPIFVIT